MIIDFGSKNTVVSIGKQADRFATAIAIDEISDEVVAFGDEAAAIQERAQSRVKVIQPVSRGSVTDLDAARRYLRLIWNSLGELKKIRGGRPRILTSTQISRLDRNVLAEATSLTRGGKPEFVWRSLASAVEAGRDIDSPNAVAVIDLGAETSEMAIFSARRVLRSKVLALGGNDLTRQIQRGASNTFSADLSWSEAERLKRKIGTALLLSDTAPPERATARDRITGLPTDVEISPADLNEWLKPYLAQIRTCLREAFSGLPPQVASDIYHEKIVLTGGGALLHGMEEFVQEAIGVQAVLVKDPLLSSVLGARKLNTRGRTLVS